MNRVEALQSAEWLAERLQLWWQGHPAVMERQAVADLLPDMVLERRDVVESSDESESTPRRALNAISGCREDGQTSNPPFLSDVASPPSLHDRVVMYFFVLLPEKVRCCPGTSGAKLCWIAAAPG